MPELSRSPHRNGLWVFLLALVSGIWGSPVFLSHRNTTLADLTPVSVTADFVSGVSEKIHTSPVITTGHPASTSIISGPGCRFCHRENKTNDDNGALAFLNARSGKFQSSAISETVTNVLDDGDLVSDISKTIDEPSTKVKRARVPTETVTEMTDAFKILIKYKPWYANYQTDTGFALSTGTPITFYFVILFLTKVWTKVNVSINQGSLREKEFPIPVVGKTIKIPWPLHYTAITGFTKGTGYLERIEEYTGEIRVIEHQILDWSTTVWELTLEPGTSEGKRERRVLDITRYDNDKNKWKWLGRISDKARDDDWIDGHALKIIHDMNGEYQGVLKKGGGYRDYFNNCRNFKEYLYKAIKY